MRVTRLCIAVVVAVTAACSSTPDSREPAELTDFDASKRFKEIWDYSLGDGQGGAYQRIAPAVDGDDVAIASADGKVALLNKMTGKRRWKESYDLAISGGVGVDDQRVFVGTADGELVALSRANGDIVWRVTVNGEVLGAPQSNGNIAVVQTYSGQLSGYEADSGKHLWTYTSQVPRLTLRGTSTPLIVLDTVMFGLANGRLIAMDIETGSVRWEQRISVPQGSTEIERLVDVDGRLLSMEGGAVVVATGYQGQVAAVDVASGRMLWAKDTSSYVGATSALGYIYVVDAEGGVSAIDASGQGASWTQTVLARRELTEPAAIGGGIAVGDLEGYLHLLSQVDGSLMARTRVDSDGLRAPMAVSGKLLYVYSNDGELVAYKIQDR